MSFGDNNAKNTLNLHALHQCFGFEGREETAVSYIRERIQHGDRHAQICLNKATSGIWSAAFRFADGEGSSYLVKRASEGDLYAQSDLEKTLQPDTRDRDRDKSSQWFFHFYNAVSGTYRYAKP